jgi:hypothetical protein
MTKEQLLARLKELERGTDTEEDHRDADSALLEFIGDSDISAAYCEIQRWYS